MHGSRDRQLDLAPGLRHPAARPKNIGAARSLPNPRFSANAKARPEGAPIILIRARPGGDAGLPDAEPDDGYRIRKGASRSGDENTPAFTAATGFAPIQRSVWPTADDERPWR
jgi:hypothetical protein